jgi:hypothetical protein
MQKPEEIFNKQLQTRRNKKLAVVILQEKEVELLVQQVVKHLTKIVEIVVQIIVQQVKQEPKVDLDMDYNA